MNFTICSSFLSKDNCKLYKSEIINLVLKGFACNSPECVCITRCYILLGLAFMTILLNFFLQSVVLSVLEDL